MGMAVRRGSIVERERAAADVVRAEDALVRIVKPDIALSIDGDPGGMHIARATWRRIEKLSDTVVRPRHGLSNVQLADGPHKAFRPPDVAIVVNGNQMRGQAAAACIAIAYLILLQRAGRGILFPVESD